MNNEKFIALILLAIVVFGTLFYWYSFRPSQIKKNCASNATLMKKEKCPQNGSLKIISEGKKIYPDCETFNDYYSRCLKEKGL